MNNWAFLQLTWNFKPYLLFATLVSTQSSSNRSEEHHINSNHSLDLKGTCSFKAKWKIVVKLYSMQCTYSSLKNNFYKELNSYKSDICPLLIRRNEVMQIRWWMMEKNVKSLQLNYAMLSQEKINPHISAFFYLLKCRSKGTSVVKLKGQISASLEAENN